jgi:leucyl-tRNA synthetase
MTKYSAALHLYYARFMTHFLHSLNLIDVQEPFARFVPIGVIKAKTYTLTKTGEIVAKDDVHEGKDGTFVHGGSGEPVTESWEKMSKSKLNGIDPMVLAVFRGDLYKGMFYRIFSVNSALISRERSFYPIIRRSPNDTGIQKVQI